MAVPAYKEWAVIVKALLEGEQIVDVRKGGIKEDGRHFGLQSARFWLYPTFEHQRADLLKAAYIPSLEQTLATEPADRAIRVEGWADVVGVATLTEPDDLARLDGKFIWNLDYAASRLKWKRRDPLWVLALRVHVLDETVTVPWIDAYGGCTSWVPLEGLPDDPATVPSRPALSDTAFEGRLKGVRESLPDGLGAVA
jgi:hypothetical protein